MIDSPAIIRERRLDERMKGDPRVAARGLFELEACLYAAAILRKRGAIPEDASGVEGRLAPDLRTVTFWRGAALAAVYCIPNRVMDFDPSRAATEIEAAP